MSSSAAQQKTQDSSEYSLLDSIIAETRLTPDDEAYGIAKRGVSAFIEELLKPQNSGEPVKKAMVDRMIAEIDAKRSEVTQRQATAERQETLALFQAMKIECEAVIDLATLTAAIGIALGAAVGGTGAGGNPRCSRSASACARISSMRFCMASTRFCISA